jgi:hypothetical protein
MFALSRGGFKGWGRDSGEEEEGEEEEEKDERGGWVISLLSNCVAFTESDY